LSRSYLSFMDLDLHRLFDDVINFACIFNFRSNLSYDYIFFFDRKFKGATCRQNTLEHTYKFLIFFVDIILTKAFLRNPDLTHIIKLEFFLLYIKNT